MTQDERLVPAGRGLDNSLADLTQAKPFGKYDRYSSPPAETNVREYLYVILKRKWLILSLVLVVTSLVTIQVYRQPSIYEAGTTIRIESKPAPVLSTGQVVINAPADPNFWGTQLKLLQNPSLARQVVLSLDLQKNPAFLGGQAQSSVFASLKRIFSRERAATPPAQNPAADQTISADEMKERQLTPEELATLEPYEDAIIGGETVEPIIGTSLVTIKYQHTDPALAQRIANTLADVFVQNNRERQESGTSKAEISLAQEIAKVQDKIHKEQDGLYAFAKEHDLPLGPRIRTEYRGGARLTPTVLSFLKPRTNAELRWQLTRRPRTLPTLSRILRCRKTNASSNCATGSAISKTKSLLYFRSTRENGRTLSKSRPK